MIDPFVMYHVIQTLKKTGPLDGNTLFEIIPDPQMHGIYRQLTKLRDWNILVSSYSPHDFSIRFDIHKNVSNL
jgi:hypothetical protein